MFGLLYHLTPTERTIASCCHLTAFAKHEYVEEEEEEEEEKEEEEEEEVGGLQLIDFSQIEPVEGRDILRLLYTTLH